MLRAKKVKRRCSVKGCHNIGNVYGLYRISEGGATAFICKNCLTEAFALLGEQEIPIETPKTEPTEDIAVEPSVLVEDEEAIPVKKAIKKPPKTAKKSTAKRGKKKS